MLQDQPGSLIVQAYPLQEDGQATEGRARVQRDLRSPHLLQQLSSGIALRMSVNKQGSEGARVYHCIG